MAFNLHEVGLKGKNAIAQKGFDETSLGTSWSSAHSSSGLSSSFGSELGFNETDQSDEDEDFMADLTRQMANYMLEYDDDDDDDDESSGPNDSFCQNTEPCVPSAEWSGCNSTSVYYCDRGGFMSSSTEPAEISAPVNDPWIYTDHSSAQRKMQPIEVYQLKNQPTTKEENYSSIGRPAMSESAQLFNPQQLQQKGKHHRHKKHGGESRNSSKNGSGMMRAVFLGGGSGWTNGSCGTGVFLPPLIDNQAVPRKKPGCSTVFIPAKVFQALELHFSNMDSFSQSSGCGGYTNRNRQDMSQQKRISEFQKRPASSHQEMQLPEEWTY